MSFNDEKEKIRKDFARMMMLPEQELRVRLQGWCEGRSTESTMNLVILAFDAGREHHG